MSDTLVVLPILVPLVAGIASMLLMRHRVAQRIIAVLGTGALLAAAAALLWTVRDGTILTMAMGTWQGPFGIVFVADALAAIMVLAAGVMGFAVAIYSLGDADADRERWGHHPLVHILLMGVCGAFLTGDLFNLYVWFEVLLIASFVLMALGGTRAQMEGAMKYVVMNLVASALLLAAVGITYGLAGTVNMADLAVKLRGAEPAGLVTAVAMLFLVAFGIKSAVFPLFFWLPSSYHAPPVAVSALFAGLLTKVGVYALFRVFTLVFTDDVAFTHTLLLWIGVVTMIVGVLGAVAQSEMRRLLSFHIISQIGYMIVALALFTPLAIAAGIFFIIHNILAKSNLFLVSGLAYRLHGTFRLERLGGLARSAPLVAVLFLVSALGLAGVPPLSGFWAKLLVVRAGLEAGAWIAVAAALAVGLLTLFSMVKIWMEAFWKTLPAGTPPPAAVPRARWAALIAPVVLLAALTALVGFAPWLLFEVCRVAGEQLIAPDAYITAVLGAPP